MSKRRVFDIDFDPQDQAELSDTPAYETERGVPERKGPMATAIAENVDALSDRQQLEAEIRAENDRLAHEYVALKKDGAIVARVLVSEISAKKLARDRSSGPDPELEELKKSIREVGLSNPIHVEESATGGYELVQGFRRWSAFKALLVETGDDAYARIPAVLVAKGAALQSLYRRMVDENLVRKDISFAEMANLAIHYGREMNVSTASSVDALYASAGRQKRSYIRHFCELMRLVGSDLKYPESIPRALGLKLTKALDADPNLAKRLSAVMASNPQRDPIAELDILSQSLTASGKEAKKATSTKPTSRQSIKLNRPQGAVRATASQGKVEIQMNRDFGAVDPRKLEMAVRALLDQLGL